MSINWIDGLKEAVKEVKKRVKKAGTRYFDTYEVIYEMLRLEGGKYYAQLLGKYQNNDHPLRQTNAEIGKQMVNLAAQLGIAKVKDAETGEDVEVYVYENITGNSDKVQLWRITD